MTSWYVGWPAVVFLLSTACGGRVAHSDDRDPESESESESESILPADKLLRELSREEKKALCRETEAMTKEYREFTCSYHAMVELAAQKPTTDAEAQAACATGYDSCMKWDLCTEVPVYFDDCPIHVEQFRTCAVEQTVSQAEAFQDFPPCSEVTTDTFEIFYDAPAPIPGICWPIVHCYDGVEPADP